MLQALDALLKRWMLRLKIFSFLAAIWAVFFSVFTIMGLRAGFEYDDGLVFSTPAYKTAQKAGTEPGSKDYWNAVNRDYKLERVKPAVWLTAWLFKVLGFKVAILCQRDPAGSDSLTQSWKPLANDFFFAGDENQKYELLEKKPFTLYFAVSDADVIQARKAGVLAVRIRKNQKSVLPAEATPRKFNEPVLPLSEF
jgi:acid phosphatase class B